MLGRRSKPFRHVNENGGIVLWTNGQRVRHPPLTPEIIAQATSLLSEILSENDKEKIRKHVAANGTDWVHQKHMKWKNGVCKKLSEAGLRENKLPTGRWDDYFMLLVEIAIGAKGGIASFVNENLNDDFYKLETS